MKILVVPSIREVYKNQIELSVDIRLIYFLKKLFKKAEIEIYNNEIKNNYDFIVLAGGNNSISKKKKDLIRNNINNLIFNFAQKKNQNPWYLSWSTIFSKKIWIQIAKKNTTLEII